MRLYSYTSEAFREMSERNWNTAKAEGFDVRPHYLGDLEADCDQKGDGWIKLLRTKVDIVLSAIGENEDTPFVFADGDVQWYPGSYWDIHDAIGDTDIAFQCDWWGRGVRCQGLFVAYGNERVRRFFEDIRDRLDEENDDQSLTNEILGEPYDLRWHLLPYRYWTQGASTGKRWKAGDPVDPPRDLMAHHANWTVGPENKQALLDAVWNKYNAIV